MTYHASNDFDHLLQSLDKRQRCYLFRQLKAHGCNHARFSAYQSNLALLWQMRGLEKFLLIEALTYAYSCLYPC